MASPDIFYISKPAHSKILEASTFLGVSDTFLTKKSMILLLQAVNTWEQRCDVVAIDLETGYLRTFAPDTSKVARGAPSTVSGRITPETRPGIDKMVRFLKLEGPEQLGDVAADLTEWCIRRWESGLLVVSLDEANRQYDRWQIDLQDNNEPQPPSKDLA